MVGNCFGTSGQVYTGNKVVFESPCYALGAKEAAVRDCVSWMRSQSMDIDPCDVRGIDLTGAD